MPWESSLASACRSSTACGPTLQPLANSSWKHPSKLCHPDRSVAKWRDLLFHLTPSRCVAYLNLLRRNIELHGLGLVGYCLMSNHVHLVVTPHNTDGLGSALRHTHGRYAIYWNALCGAPAG
jgi:Transposase IS200 like